MSELYIVACLFNLYAKWHESLPRLEAHAEIKELLGEISIISNIRIFIPLWRKWERAKSLLMKVKVKELKRARHSRSYNHCISHPSWRNEWKREQWRKFILKAWKCYDDSCLKADLNIFMTWKWLTKLNDILKKPRRCFMTRDPSSQAWFSMCRRWIWKMCYKESDHWKW